MLRSLPITIKSYPEQVLERLKLIKSIKVSGFALAEIDTFFELWRAEDTVCADELSGRLDKKIDQIDEQINRLQP